MQLALLILLVVAFGSVVGWIGASALTSWAFALYAPVFLKSLHTRQHTLKRDILRNKAELQATSSQDQFAKWAKLRRKLDKGLSDLETINADVASHRAQFDRVFSTLLYVITSGLQWAIVWWYRREPAFWMPAGWVPRGMDRWLSFGGGPRGSVSATVWSIVCKKVAGILARVVVQWVPNPFDSPIWNRRGEKGGKLSDTVRAPGLVEKNQIEEAPIEMEHFVRVCAGLDAASKTTGNAIYSVPNSGNFASPEHPSLQDVVRNR